MLTKTPAQGGLFLTAFLPQTAKKQTASTGHAALASSLLKPPPLKEKQDHVAT